MSRSLRSLDSSRSATKRSATRGSPFQSARILLVQQVTGALARLPSASGGRASIARDDRGSASDRGSRLGRIVARCGPGGLKGRGPPRRSKERGALFRDDERATLSRTTAKPRRYRRSAQPTSPVASTSVAGRHNPSEARMCRSPTATGPRAFPAATDTAPMKHPNRYSTKQSRDTSHPNRSKGSPQPSQKYIDRHNPGPFGCSRRVSADPQ